MISGKKSPFAGACGAFILATSFMPTPGSAASIAAGLVTRFHAGPDNVGLYIAAGPGSACPSNWYYAVRSDFANADEFKLLVASAISVYSMSKTITLYHPTTGCSLQRFTTIDTDD